MLDRRSPWVFVRSIWRILVGRPRVPASLRAHPVLPILLNRRSVRSFEDTAIPDEIFTTILEAGRLAPSTVNLQTWSFSTFTAAEWATTFGQPLPFRGVRAVIVLADTHRDMIVLDVFPKSPLVEYTVGVMNASLSAMAMNIAAEALGVGSVMLSETGRSGFLDARYLADKLALPSGVIPIMTIVFGFPRGSRPPMPPKLPLETVSFAGSYREAAPSVMRDWLDQMVAGYKASHVTSSFEQQLKVYRSKIEQAEKDLQAMVLGTDAPED